MRKTGGLRGAADECACGSFAIAKLALLAHLMVEPWVLIPSARDSGQAMPERVQTSED